MSKLFSNFNASGLKNFQNYLNEPVKSYIDLNPFSLQNFLNTFSSYLVIIY